MRIGNLDGRLALLLGDTAVDVASASDGRFGPDPQSAYASWDGLLEWSRSVVATGVGFDEARLGPPVPKPRQTFAIGLNYRDHAAEAGADVPRHPQVFTKFSSCFTGPRATVDLASEYVDWEIELVVVLGRRAERVPADQAWAHVAGLTVGQDLSDRKLQLRRPQPAQYSLGKSRPGFGPMGPAVVSLNEVPAPDDLGLTCALNGEEVQKSRTSEMIFPVPEIIARLSAVLPLFPGDVIFTGTPGGIGGTRTPPRFLAPGDKLVSTIDRLGSLVTDFAAGSR